MIDISQWAEFGILAVIISVLFTVIITGFKIFINFIEKLHENFKEMTSETKKQHTDNIRMLTQQHREERIQWGIESGKRDQRYEASMKEFSQAIRDLREKI